MSQKSLLRLVLTCLLVSVTACATRTVGAPHKWQLRGEVRSVQSPAIEIRHKSGQIVRLTLDPRTAYVSRHGGVSLQSLGPGRRVSVEVESDADGAQRALRIEVVGERTRR